MPIVTVFETKSAYLHLHLNPIFLIYYAVSSLIIMRVSKKCLRVGLRLEQVVG